MRASRCRNDPENGAITKDFLLHALAQHQLEISITSFGGDAYNDRLPESMGIPRPCGRFFIELLYIPLPGAFVICIHLICPEGHTRGDIEPAIIETEQGFGTHSGLTGPPLIL
jgi:hypothetical protein